MIKCCGVKQRQKWYYFSSARSYPKQYSISVYIMWCKLLFIPRHFKKFGVLCYTLHPKNCVKSIHPSVCTSVRPSAHHFHSLLGAFFNQFSSNFLWELILGRCVLGLQMGKFWQISTELGPLIDVRNWFSFFLSLAFLYRFSSNLVWELILGMSVLGLQMGKFWQISTGYGPWVTLETVFHTLSLAFLYRFSSNLVWEFWYWEWVSWDCRWVNLGK